MVQQKKLLFLITLTVATVSLDLLRYLAYPDVYVCQFICKYDSGRVFRGFVCANGQDNVDVSTQKERIKGSFLPFPVNLLRIKNYPSKHLPVSSQQ